MKMFRCLKEAAAFTVLVLLFSLLLSALPQETSRSLAALTGLPPALSITNYDISLRTALASDTLFVSVVCTIRNESPDAVERIDFDLFAREQYYGVKVKVANITRLAYGRHDRLIFSRASLTTPADPALEGSDKFPKITRVSLSAPLKKGDRKSVV